MPQAIDLFRQFALSVDIIDENNYHNIQDWLKKYFITILKANFFEILIDGIRVQVGKERQPGLSTVLSNRDGVVVPIFSTENGGIYHSQVCYSYHRDKKLWITAPDGGLLIENPNNCIDSWSHSTDLPPYRDYNHDSGPGDTRTSIIIPLKYDKRVFGFLNLEFPRHYECTNIAKEELEKITDAISRIFWIYETDKHQFAGTNQAFTNITSNRNFFSPFQKDNLFLASASNCDISVIAEIKNVLNEEDYSNKINLIYWKDLSRSGNINAQIRSAIANCRYGICYFSECSNNNKFFDNPNVVFEAGMLHALTNDPKGQPLGWIPIRESHSEPHSLTPPPPFDFSSERILIVQRSRDGKLNKEDFICGLRKRLDSLIRGA